MKTGLAVIGVCVAFYGYALAQTNQTNQTTTNTAVMAAKTKPFVMPDKITTRSGRVYQEVKLQTFNASEINIRHFDGEGVMQIDNIKLADLPDSLQKAFGYDPKKAVAYDEKEKTREKIFSNANSGMSQSELRRYYYTNTLDRRIDEIDEQIRKAEIAEKVRQEMLKERAVQAQEEAARAATLQALNPPVIKQTTIINP
jgi:hypothetical protein